MTLYTSVVFSPSITEVKTEEDMKAILEELKKDTSPFYSKIPGLGLPHFLSDIRNSFRTGNRFVIFKKGEEWLRVDISEAVRAMQFYDEARKRHCFNCANYKVESVDGETNYSCRIGTREVPVPDCKDGFQNAKLKGETKPLELILGEL